jgi:hypothetical protein
LFTILEEHAGHWVNCPKCGVGFAAGIVPAQLPPAVPLPHDFVQNYQAPLGAIPTIPLAQEVSRHHYDRDRFEEQLGPTGFDVAGMVLGLLGLVLFCIPIAAWVFGGLAVVFSAVSLGQRQTGMGHAGLITGVIAIVLGVIIFAIALSVYRPYYIVY